MAVLGGERGSVQNPIIKYAHESGISIEKGPSSSPLEQSVPAEIFKAEVYAWAERVGVTPGLLTIRLMKHKWASCSSKGNLTFDADLLYQPADFRRKAIIHEQLHLKISYHGKLFRQMEKTFLTEGD